MKISIITATYNREKLLSRLYKSLCEQTCKDFEWIVIDDGSVDDTEELVNEFINKKIIDITYVKKINGGKHTAMNLGIDIAKCEFCFFVDSDDFLPSNSIEIIYKKLNHIKNLDEYDKLAGICGDNQDQNANLIGVASPNNRILNYLDYRYKFKISGDKSEIYKTKILKAFKFPEFKNEKFCPEALIWNRISREYDMFFFNEKIYCREYQDEGLTSKIYEIRKKSPKATLLYYKELFQNRRVPLYYRARALVNYFRFKR